MVFAAALVPLAHAPVLAESLFDALAAAYSSNPTLRAERARQRITDEQVPQALAGWRPQVFAQGQLSSNFERVIDKSENAQGTAEDQTNPANLSITLTQPIFNGFRTLEQRNQAESTVKAGRQQLLSVEQTVLSDTVDAYMNVIRFRQIVSLVRSNVSALQTQLEAAQTRFDVGEVTRTDVAQARARLNEEKARLAGFQNSLAQSVATYTQLVGRPPGSLKYPPLASLPKSLEAAYGLSQRINPNILFAIYQEMAARHAIEVQRGDLLPEVSVQVAGTLQTNDLLFGKTKVKEDREVSFIEDPHLATKELSITGVISVPLYQGGAVSSRVRQAKQQASQRRIQIIEQGRAVRAFLEQQWADLGTTRDRVAAGKAQVSANEVALEGVRQEYLVGSRTTLDVLDALREVTDSKITLVDAEADRIAASYRILQAIGHLTARSLKLKVDYYDPKEYYNYVRDRWLGLDAPTVK